jgi:hypothetical protein
MLPLNSHFAGCHPTDLLRIPHAASQRLAANLSLCDMSQSQRSNARIQIFIEKKNQPPSIFIPEEYKDNKVFI